MAPTPGPWKAFSMNVLADVTFRGEKDTSIIASCNSGLGSFEERHANARLIAAAPDLLAALSECLWLLRDIQEKPGLVQEKARKAIIKATGKEPK